MTNIAVIQRATALRTSASIMGVLGSGLPSRP